MWFFHRPITPLNMLIKVLQFLTFGLCFKCLCGIIRSKKNNRKDDAQLFQTAHFKQQDRTRRVRIIEAGNLIGIWDSYFVLFLFYRFVSVL